jgi:hypothetical protein
MSIKVIVFKPIGNKRKKKLFRKEGMSELKKMREGESKMILFDSSILLVAGSTVLIACLDKMLSTYGFHGLGIALKIIIPILGFMAGIYFIEMNPILEWLK